MLSFAAWSGPGDRFVMIGQMTCERKMIAECNVQGFVVDKMVFEAKVLGVPLKRG